MNWPPSQPQLHHILLVLLAAGPLLIQLQAATAQQQQDDQLPITRPGCPDKCGDISIPFPFGMKPGCFLDGFQVTCNHSFQPPRAFLAKGHGGSLSAKSFVSYSVSKTGNVSTVDGSSLASPVELIDISVAKNEARAYGEVASLCSTNSTGGFWRYSFSTLAWKTERPKGLLVSLTRNVLVGIGIEVEPIVGRFNASKLEDYLVSCRSTIVGNLQLASNGSCSGRGCCQASLPGPDVLPLPLTGVEIGIPTRNLDINNTLWATNPCSFAMLVEASWYNFSTADLYGDTSDRFPRGVPYVIDFAIRDGTKCPAEGQQPPLSYACVSGNSSCADVTYGYICKCSEHYEGNPYILNGCQDIDECKHPDLYPCYGICRNRLLGYDCPCKPGMKGDGKKGTCQAVLPQVAKVVVVMIGGFFIVAALIFLILLRREKKKMREFYKKNGGPILEKAKMIKLFRKEDLKGILKSSNLIGKGGFAVVYKGLLDNKLVVVKRPISGNVLENEQFANEVIIQSQVIHKNIVRLIGCCLEVTIPMLVYEYIPKGSLEDILHSNEKLVPLNMDVRLSIVVQLADGLVYMHSKANNKIIHGDVKPANILLDDNFVPKIAGFRISRLVARDKQYTEEANVGDMSYMDPIYIQTGLLTEKSDVYSFGVVILELISRKKATHYGNNSLVRDFLEAHKEEKRPTEFFDNEIALTSNLELLHSLARIAMKCLNLDVDQRPSMIEVAELLLLLNRSPNP